MGTTKKRTTVPRDAVPPGVWTWDARPAAKLLLLYLNTAPDSNVVGLAPFEATVVAARTGMPELQVLQALRECVEGGKVAVSSDYRNALVLDRWARAAKTAGERMEAIRLLADGHPTLVEAFLAHHPELRRAVEAQQRIARGGQGEVTSAIPAEFSLFMLDARLEEQWDALVESWRKNFPTVNVSAELTAAHAWLLANRSTKKGRKADVVMFLHNWMRRASKDTPKATTAGKAKREAQRERFGSAW